MTTRILRTAVLALLGLGFIFIGLFTITRSRNPHEEIFDGQRAYQDVLTQMSFGPRTVGSQAHEQALAWIKGELEQANWEVEIQDAQMMGHPVQNIIARRSAVPSPILLGAHYDSRLVADQDTGPGRNGPVPGADDGASGVAVLLELARSLPSSSTRVELVFFDAEDDGDLPGWDWLLGSRAFVAALGPDKPREAIILDMIGDAHLDIFIERNSNPKLVKEIWDQAAVLGFQKQFIPEPKYSMLDDHTPFLEAGIPAVDIIDFDYPYWHTSADTADKVSANSLQIVGRTLWAWLATQK